MDVPRGVTRGFLSAATILLMAGSGAALAQTPTNLRVEGVQRNRHALNFAPDFCWDFVGNQTNWQVQVDDDPNYEPTNTQPTPQVWFWDSGQQDKGAQNTARCGTMRAINKAAFVSIGLDRRPHIIYWHVRVQVNGTTWGPWVESDVRMNQYPLMPQNVTVQSDPVSSIDPVDPIPVKVIGKTYYVSPTGNDLNAGTQTAPFKTLGKATKVLLKGDTLLVRGGIYNENVYISANAGHASGEPGNPITVKAYPGETPIVRALSSGTKAALTVEGPSSRLSDWVIDGITVGGSSAAIGYYVTGAKSITVKNCHLESTMTTAAQGMIIANSCEDIRVTGCKFDQPVADQLEVGAARNVEIRSNEFTEFNSRHCIHAHGGSADNLLIADNYFHDGDPFEATVFLYLGTQGSRVVNNVFANIRKVNPNNPSDVGLGDAIINVRSGEITVDNNVFYNVEGVGILEFEFTEYSTFRNNIFMNNGYGILLRGGILSGSATTGTIADYNVFYQNDVDLSIPSGETGLLAHAPLGNCLGGPPPSNPACDPRFVNAAAKDFHLQSGSPAIDAGDPSNPVPVGGGSRVDIGRYEVGAAAPPYNYQSRFTVGDTTPRFGWDIRDIDNVIGDLLAGDTDFQTRYQVQIDPKPTFDSLSEGRPMLDSGVVSSLVEGFTVPNSRALTTGEYYMRVRQWDDNDAGNRGAWSDHNFRFRVSGEPQPPYLASLVPSSDSVGVSENTTIVAHVKDDGVGVNIASVRMYVNGTLVTPVITGNINDYALTYTPPAPFGTNATVTVRIVADDFNLSPPGLDSTYGFSIRDTVPPQAPTNVRVQL